MYFSYLCLRGLYACVLPVYGVIKNNNNNNNRTQTLSVVVFFSTGGSPWTVGQICPAPAERGLARHNPAIVACTATWVALSPRCRIGRLVVVSSARA